MLLNGKDDKNWDMWCVYAKRAKMLLYFSIIIDQTEIWYGSRHTTQIGFLFFFRQGYFKAQNVSVECGLGE